MLPLMSSLLAFTFIFSLPATAQSTDALNARSPKETVAAFHSTLKEGDLEGLAKTIAPDAVLFESGGVERSFKEYSSHHMKADMVFMKSVRRENMDVQEQVSGDMALVFSNGVTTGEFRKKKINSRFTETMVLRRIKKKWQIVHIHWSSSAIQKGKGHGHSSKKGAHKKSTSPTSKSSKKSAPKK